MTKKLLIVEEALRDLKAHWFEYIKTIKQAINSKGWQVDVAANKNVAPEIIRELNCLPLFKHARYLSSQKNKLPGERYYGFILHSLRCLWALWPFLKKQRYDEVFVPTVLVHHLLAWFVIMRLHPDRPGHLTLFFVMTPGEWDGHQKVTVFPKSTVIFKKMLKLFRSLVDSGKVTLAVETAEAKTQFEQLCGLPFSLMPHPVPFEASDHLKKAAQKYTLNVQQNNHPVSFCCFGFARHEKGSDILKAAIEKLLQNQEDFNGHFTLQWTDAFRMPDGTTCVPGNFLETHDKVRIIDRAVGSAEYEELLSKTDCMILPYRNSSYHARVSRVAIEAACNGIPVIYTKGGWLEENTEKFGAGIGITDESVDELVKAIRIFAGDATNFSLLAKERMPVAKAYYAPANFSEMLVGK